MPLPFLAAVFPQLTHGAQWTVAAKKTPSRVSPWLQPLGVFFVGNIADVSLPSAPGHMCTVTSACWMAAKVQVSEPLPEAYAKDSGNAAWRAAAGQIRRIPCLNVSSCVSLGARSCDSFRKMSICRLYAKKKWGYFYTLVFFIEFPSLSTLRRPLSSLSDPATPPSHSSMMFCVNRTRSEQHLPVLGAEGNQTGSQINQKVVSIPEIPVFGGYIFRWRLLHKRRRRTLLYCT